MKQWYEQLFENYGTQYDRECFTRGTTGECDFIEKEIGKDTSRSIIDIGCGTGRHSIELAKRGYRVTGIDLSDSMLARARQKAAMENLHVNFIRHDARALPFRDEFDVALLICEGAFPLMETDEMNYAILQNAARALRKKGKLIMTTLNGLFPLLHSAEEYCASNSEEGNARYRDNRFDMMTFRDHNFTTFQDDGGNSFEIESNERYYIPPEITWLLKSAGFICVEIFGARLGAFSRDDRLTHEDFEMLVIAEK
jgi:SAM-dependent methyltransferase